MQDAPDGIEWYQKASAWYYVSYSDRTNPFMMKAREDWQRGDSRGSAMMFVSFPWICAFEQLCQIKAIRAEQVSS